MQDKIATLFGSIRLILVEHCVVIDDAFMNLGYKKNKIKIISLSSPLMGLFWIMKQTIEMKHIMVKNPNW